MTDALESSLATYSGVGGAVGLFVAVLLTVLRYCLKKYVFACDCKFQSNAAKAEITESATESPVNSLRETIPIETKIVKVASDDVEAGISMPVLIIPNK